MKFNFECLNCNINQVVKVAKQLGLERNQTEEIMREVLDYLSQVDYDQCNAQVMRGTWEILVKYAPDENIYHTLKEYYNHAVLEMEPEIQEMIETSKEPFDTALRVAIAGNLIDFAAKSKFDIQILRENIMRIRQTDLGIDDSMKLYHKLETAKTLLYLGDNCGEICLDKIFLAYIKKEFPNINLYFAVRGKPILNDVLIEDAEAVGVNIYAHVIDNGDNCPGTVLERTSTSFRSVYDRADVIIAKGLGNYESLSEEMDKEIFFLFMAKCDSSAEKVGVEKMSIVCMAQQ